MHRSILANDNKLKVLFEDDHLIAVEKPYGVLSQGNENTRSICDDVSEYLKENGEKAEVFVLHRLDKTTAGALVLAKTKSAAGKMSALIQSGGFSKVYTAVCEGELQDTQGVFEDLLYHDKGKNKTFTVKRERRGVKKAKLSYETLGTAEVGGTLAFKVRVKLFTGRTHQIRVQFASRKHPLIGDRKYGSNVSAKEIALWSSEIRFIHPLTHEEIRITSEPKSEVFSMI